MKAYGHSRTDKLECHYGCCTSKSGKEKNCRDAVDRANRKTARHEGKMTIKEEMVYQTTDDTYPTQGGGRVRYDYNLEWWVFTEKPDCPGLEVGDYMPKDWSIAG